MKRTMTRLILSLLALFAMPLAASAANTIKIEPFAVVPGGEADVTVSFTADGDYIGFQTQVTLPEGLSFVKTGNSYAALSPQWASTHLISANAEGQTLKVVSFSSSNAPFGRSGALFTFRVMASADFAGGSASIANTIFSTADFKEVTFTGSSSEVSSQIPASGVEIDFAASGIEGNDLTLNVGETKTIAVKVTPADSTDKLTWSSSNEAVATVDANGKVTAVKAGEATITVTTTSGKSATLKVTVLQPSSGVEIDFSASGIEGNDLTLNVGESKEIKVTVTPADSTDALIWTSSNPEIATVDANGKVTAVKAGETTITVTTTSGKSATLKVTVLQPSSGVEIDFAASGIESENLTLNVGETKTIAVKVTPTDSTDKLTWSSSNEAVATVDANGKVTAVKAGEATITVTATSGKSAMLKVTVLQPSSGVEIDFTASGIEGENLTLNVGESKTIAVKVAPADSTDKLTWSSSNEAVATVDANGKVTAVKAGEATITVTTTSGKSATLKVTVLQPSSGVEIDFAASGIEGNDLTLNVGEIKTIAVKVTPADSTDKLTWSSSNEAVATVDANGKVTAVKAGEVTITVTTTSGKSATLKVTVLQPSSGVEIDFAASGIEGNDLTLNVGETKTIAVKVTPADSTDKLTWTSSNEAVATVDANGKVTAVKAGEATITITTTSGKSATLKVTVLQPSSGVEIDFAASGIEGNDLTLNVGESKEIKVKVTPADSTDKLTWTSSNEAVATVDANGKVTAVKAGETTVTVTTTSGKSATLKVTVLQPSSGVEIDFASSGIEGNDLTLNVGESKEIKVTVTPADSTDKLTWSSSNETVATVDANGKVTAIKAGEATITVTTTSGKSATLKVSVLQPSSGVEIDFAASGIEGNDLTLNVGESKEIKVTVTPADSTDALTWTSSNPEIATVDANGKVSAVKAGESTITVTTTSGKSAALKVTVLQPSSGVEIDFAASGIEGNDLTLNVGESKEIKVTVTPADSTDKLTWSSSNETVATVDANGKVTAIKAGEATITVTTTSGKSATLKVTVLQPSSGVEIDFAASGIEGNDLTLNVGETKTIAVKVTPADSTDALTWTSSNPEIATVDANGKVTAVKAGEATITVTATSGKSAMLKVTVLQPSSGVEIDFAASGIEGNDLTLNVGESKEIKVKVTPADSTDALTWTSSNPEIATVDANGKVTAVKAGEVTITVTTTSGKSATLKVTVLQPATGIELNEDKVNLKVGDTAQLTATILPADSTDTEVVWETSDASVATVDANGLVTAIAIGDAEITVSVKANIAIKAVCKVSVVPTLATMITLDKTSVTVVEGSEFDLVATVLPDDATDKTVAWSSSDETIATVDDKGHVKVLGSGECSIIAATTDGSDLKASCKLNALSGVYMIWSDSEKRCDVYSINGMLVKKGCSLEEYMRLDPGIYIVGGKKILKR